jgi:SNF2 family DNA or RNA helicase
MGLGKTLIVLRYIARRLAVAKAPVVDLSRKRFLVAVPTQAILTAQLEETRKFDPAYVLDHMVFTPYRSLAKTLAASSYH